ncbi:MAG TPA: hypothetical protein DCL54_05415 [Alphaproteobacteria bacterium]|nr:hypothetical protein [Alphaproteobacteria bacterium]
MSNAPAPQKLTPQQVSEAFKKVQHLQQIGQWEASEPILRALESALPKHPAICAALAHNAKRRGDTGMAERYLRDAIRLAPQEPAFQNNLASLYLGVERPADAKPVLEALLLRHPQFPDAIYNMGRTMEELQDATSACAWFEQYAVLAPRDPKGYVRLMAQALHREDFEGVFAWAAKAKGHGLETFDLVYYEACALAAQGQHARALEMHRRAQALDPARWQARKGAANMLFALERDDEGLAELYTISQTWPELLDVHAEHSSRSWTTGRKDGFLATFRALDERGQATPSHLTIEAQLLIRAERIEEAIDLMERSLRRFPDHPEILGMLATCYSHTPDTARAAQLFERTLRINPRDVLALQNYGFMAISTHKPDLAVTLFDALLQVNDVDQLALAGQGLALRELGDSRADILFDFERFVRPFDVPLPADYASVEAFNAELAEQLAGLHTQKLSPIDQTLRGGTQTPGQLFGKHKGAVAALQTQLGLVIRQYLRELPDDDRHPFLKRKAQDFRFSGSWSCQLKSGGFHTNHVHNMGWISSAYYVQLPEVLKNEDRKEGWINFGQSNLAAGPKDVPGHYVRPRVGRLVLFPSYFWHGTVPFESGTARVTVAFDALPQ